MKKIGCVIVSLVIILNLFTVNVFAETAPRISEIKVDRGQGIVVIKGNIAEGPWKEVTVTVLSPSGRVDYIGQTTSGAEGTYTFSYRLGSEAKDGQYVLLLGGAFTDSPLKEYFDFMAPGEVDGLKLSPGDGSALIEWENPGTEDFEGVNIYINGNLEVFVGKDTHTFRKTGLSNGMAYTFTLKSVDRYGNKSQGVDITGTPESGEVSATPTPMPTSEPTQKPTPNPTPTPTTTPTPTPVPGTKVTVTIPYTLKEGENPNAIVAYYINEAGERVIVTNCKYDPVSGMLTFETSHLSKYIVEYNKVEFEDVLDGAWYYDAVTFAAARGITVGIGNGNFGPNDNVTRAQALVMIMKAFGINPDQNAENNFSDAGNTYYTGYLAMAKKLGITVGVGDNRFAPDRQVTRQELFVLVYNTLKNMNELPTGITAKSLLDFKDAENVADYANNAIELFVKTGIVAGSEGNIMPNDLAARSQFVQILYNIMNR